MGQSRSTRTWVVPPQRAVWMPPKTPHRLVTSSEVQLRATELPVEYDQKGPAGRIMQLLLDELGSLPRLPYNLPMPRTPPLAKICERLRALSWIGAPPSHFRGAAR